MGFGHSMHFSKYAESNDLPDITATDQVNKIARSLLYSEYFASYSVKRVKRLKLGGSNSPTNATLIGA